MRVDCGGMVKAEENELVEGVIWEKVGLNRKRMRLKR